MIIDSHLHLGSIAKFHMPKEILMESLEKYHIDFGIVSNIEGCEFDHLGIFIQKEAQISQMEVNRRTLSLLKDYPNKLRGQFWIKPHTEGFSEEVEEFLTENKDYFVGLKMHPFHSNLKITDERCRGYLRFANEHHMSVAVHTAGDENSNPYHVYCAAQQYPNIKFIMVHMGLGTDHDEAIEYIQKLDNLYGDTTWVNAEKVIEAIRKCGSHKIIFGTDNPIDGLDTYRKYNEILEKGKEVLSKIEYENLLFLNAQRVFGLTIF